MRKRLFYDIETSFNVGVFWRTGYNLTINPGDIKKVIKAKIKYPNHVICGYDEVHDFEDPSNIGLPKVVVNKKKELIYISRALVPCKKKKERKSNISQTSMHLCLQ